MFFALDLKIGPPWLKMAQNWFLDCLKLTKDVSCCAKIAPRWPKIASCWIKMCSSWISKTIKNWRKNNVFGFRRRTNVTKTDVFYFWPQNCLVLAQDGPDMFSGLPNIALKCSHVAPFQTFKQHYDPKWWWSYDPLTGKLIRVPAAGAKPWE